MISPQSDLNPNEIRPVLIASPPRSGSSLTASLVSAFGFFGGTMKGADAWNPHGYYENEAVTELVVEYMRSHDHKGLGKRFHPLDLSGPSDHFAGEVVSRIRSEGLCDGQRWFYKNTKIPFCWRLWDQHFPNAQWVTVRRDKNQILDSLIRTPFMDAYSGVEEWESFLSLYEVALDEIERNCDAFPFNVSSIFGQDSSEIDSLLSFLSKASVEVAYSIIDRSIWDNEK